MCLTAASMRAQVSSTPTSDGAMISPTPPRASTFLPAAHPGVEEATDDYPLAEAMSFTPDTTTLSFELTRRSLCCTVQKSRYVGLKAGQAYGMHPVPDDTTGYL